jgi:hypothetical protein
MNIIDYYLYYHPNSFIVFITRTILSMNPQAADLTFLGF